MKYVPMNKFMIQTTRGLIFLLKERWGFSSQFSIYLLTALLSLSIFVTSADADAYRANSGQGKACDWYTISPGDTLRGIARYSNTTVMNLAHINHIANINRIFVGQRLCIPTTARGSTSGLLPNGTVRRFAYNALGWSSPQQVARLLRQAAARHRLPANLTLAIAWQESGWKQHVIAHDGGIGVMQIMPSTAQGLNRQVGGHYDPYKLPDNIELGAIYLHSLWQGFHGNQAKVISAYNEGGWSVTHRGIFNWPYVHNVQALMKRY